MANGNRPGRIGSLAKSILPIIIMVLLQFAAAALVPVLYPYFASETGSLNISLFGYTLADYSTETGLSQLANVCYGIIAVFVFGIWYFRAFVRPNRPKRSDRYPRGFSFHTICAIFFLAIGMQYMTTLVVGIVSYFQPDWLDAYTTLLESSGYSDITLDLLFYTVILAPIVEELVFRGLMFRFARRATTFVFATIWQAFFFGVAHFNWIQGIYAFTMALFLGFVVHRGRSIKYSILVHMLFNLLGLFAADFITSSLEWNYVVVMAVGLFLTIFACWLFFTDFKPIEKEKPKE